MPRYGKKKSLKKQVNSNKMAIARQKADVEKKFKQSVGNGDSVDTTSKVVILTDISGTLDGVSGRDGEAIRVKTISIRGILYNNVGSPKDNVVRLLVWQAKSPQAVSQTIANTVLDSLTVQSLYDWQRKEQIVVKYDQTVTMDTFQHSIIPFKIRISGLNTRCVFSGTSTGFASHITGHYYFGFFSTIAVAENPPTMDFQGRLTYTDI